MHSLLYCKLLLKLLYPITSKLIDLLQQVELHEGWTFHLIHISVQEDFPCSILFYLQPRGRGKIRLYFSLHFLSCTVTSQNHGYFLYPHCFSLSRQYCLHEIKSFKHQFTAVSTRNTSYSEKPILLWKKSFPEVLILFPCADTASISFNFILSRTHNKKWQRKAFSSLSKDLMI